MQGKILLGAVVAIAMVGATGCGKKRSVSRVSAKSTTDLSGNWNDTDARLTSEALIKQCFSAGWLPGFVDENDRKPGIRVRKVVNKTDEHIDAQVFIKNIEKARINSGKVRVLAQAGSELNSVADEQDLGASGAVDEESAPSVGALQGADFVVFVRMSSILDQADEGLKAKFYKINFELKHSTTGETVWIGDHEIKKVIEQDSASW